MKSIIPTSILLALAILVMGCSSSTDGWSKDSPAPTRSAPSRPAGANSTGLGYGGTETPGSSFYGASPGR